MMKHGIWLNVKYDAFDDLFGSKIASIDCKVWMPCVKRGFKKWCRNMGSDLLLNPTLLMPLAIWTSMVSIDCKVWWSDLKQILKWCWNIWLTVKSNIFDDLGSLIFSGINRVQSLMVGHKKMMLKHGIWLTVKSDAFDDLIGSKIVLIDCKVWISYVKRGFKKWCWNTGSDLLLNPMVLMTLVIWTLMVYSIDCKVWWSDLIFF